MARKQIKKQALSVRLDDKTRFLLDFIGRIEGQNATTVFERSIQEKANNTGFAQNQYQDESPLWREIWHVSEGVRQLRFLVHPAINQNIYLTFEEEEIVDFCEQHWEFFSTNPVLENLIPARVDILWPNMSEYIEEWRESKSTVRWLVGQKMRKHLEEAGVEAPEWPPQRAQPRLPDLDDEIPF